MSSVKSQFESVVTYCLNSMVEPFAKYVVENHSALSETTEEELAHTFREMMSFEKPPASPVMQVGGMTGMGPSLAGGLPAGFGNIREVTPKKPKTIVKKDAPAQVWLSVDEYKKYIKEGAKICGYCSSRAKEHKDMVCGAVCENTSQKDERDWRCVTCKDKKGDIYKKIPNPINGINPDKVFSNIHVPGSPSVPSLQPTLPPAPPSLSAFPNLNSLMPKPSIPTIPSIPAMPSIPNLPSIPSIPMAPVPIPQPVVEPEPESQISITKRHAGLGAQHLLADNADIANVLLKLDSSSGTQVLMAVGKFSGSVPNPAPSNYLSLLTELDESDKAVVNRYKSISGYSFEGMPAALPSLPCIPPIPGLPSIPGF